MRRKQRVLVLLAILVMIAAAKVGQQLWRWYAFADERVAVATLEAQLDSAGLGVISTHLRADSLRIAIEGLDDELARSRQQLDRYERQAGSGGMLQSLQGRHRDDLAAFNQRVRERNAHFSGWRTVVDSNHVYVDRYNLLVDSIQALTARMGEPYYSIPSPAEIANRHGLEAPG
ncbi:MAG: hypothetical protein WD737_06840 [Gemmatimonadota bacterium]